MSQTRTDYRRGTPEPLPVNIRSVQPGGGKCYQIELAWGRLRRWYLRTFRPGYVRRMAERRLGSTIGSPHDVLDPRDLKYCRNVCTAGWREADDPFRWRDRLPLARWGLAELQIFGWPLLAATVGLLLLQFPYSLAASVPAVMLGLVVYFFRDPPRQVPQANGVLVSPADGTVAEIAHVEHDDYIQGPAVRIGIFLSIFNVHINRAPARAQVIKLAYHPGLFLNALKAESAQRNENLWIGLEEEDPPYRPLVVRQISGLIARRIVCALRPGDVVERGEKFGMIKLGSRTELIVPAEDLAVEVSVGQKVLAGSTVVARYGSTAENDN
jgi:phosphatidylserine decarboxylase